VSASYGNLDRFSGFAELYDANRPSAPARLGPLLCAYAGLHIGEPAVVDLGSGTGLSSRWAAAWARSVIGVEPNADMRAQAVARAGGNETHIQGVSHATGLPDASTDVVLAVQAMHWMEPTSTLREVARVLRPGGVFAAIDADWPPMSGSVGAEQAWADLHGRIRVLEARISCGASDDELRAPILSDDPALVDDDLADPHRNRAMPGGVQSWSKTEHLARIRQSGLFSFSRELVMDESTTGGADRFAALMRSQGSYQDLRKRGLSDEEIGMDVFDAAVRSHPPASLAFCWRVRLGFVQTP
jgi:SAM-dependent methyltransferase